MQYGRVYFKKERLLSHGAFKSRTLSPAGHRRGSQRQLWLIRKKANIPAVNCQATWQETGAVSRSWEWSLANNRQKTRDLHLRIPRKWILPTASGIARDSKPQMAAPHDWNLDFSPMGPWAENPATPHSDFWPPETEIIHLYYFNLLIENEYSEAIKMSWLIFIN